MDVCARECGICYEAYRVPSRWRVPKLLLCHHSLCLSCLRKLVCHNRAFSFISCPFCRTVTLVPEQGLQALKNDEDILRETSAQSSLPASGVLAAEHKAQGEEEEEEEEPPSASECSLSDSTLSLDMDFNYVTHSSVFTVSSMVPPNAIRVPASPGAWHGFHMQEVQNTFVVGLPSRVTPVDIQPPISSVENLRLCFAVGIIILIVSIFFMLVFLK
ncbi:E3 ubiquitin-protein ligase TRIM23-like [Alligator sinensis]|uniref:E3 ubiquitin-protein ligase TRIM23-like n=1 Tax=Alligator sinensis TaxID=38654 RepID=A0A3Q0GGT7_ALLSI|nr:E3 ubiquitin-protein ligase TRIM23-like [Alligator sinensis]